MAVAARPEISKILLDLGIEPVDVYAVDNAEQTYLAALREGISTIEVASKDNKGDERSRILREEIKRIREKKRKKVNVDKLFARRQVIPTNRIKPQALLPGSNEGEEKKIGGIGEIHSILDNIIGILRMGNKQEKKEAERNKKERESRKRKIKENVLESAKGVVTTGKKLAKKIISPFAKILGSIGNFLKFVLAGYLFNVIFKWFTDPENQKKIETLTRFFKDWWPALTVAALAFLTPLGLAIGGLTAFLTKALPALLALSKNPLVAGAALFTVGGIAPKIFPGLVKDVGDREVEELLEDQSKEEIIDQLKEEQENRNAFQKGFEFLTGKGKLREDQIYKLETGKDRNYGGFGFSGGNQQQTGSDNNTGAGSGFSDVKAEPNMGTFTGDGFMKEFEGTAGFQEFNKGGVVSGAGNKDTVPAMLTPGEFVMRKDAVKKYGVDTLAGMNAAASITHNTTNNTNNNRSTINTTNNTTNNSTSNNITQTIGAYKNGGLVQHFNEGGLVGNMVEIVKDTDNSPTPVNLFGGSNFIPAKTIGLVALEVPVSRTTEKTIVLPEKRITKEDQTPMKIGSKTIPDIMIVNRSAYRAMTTRSLGIQDLVGV